MSILSVGDVAREIGQEYGVALHPKVLSDLFYSGALNKACCPVIGGRRMVPRDYLPQIVWALKRAGKIEGGAA